MKREDNMLMESLSRALFGKPYTWRKLTKRGVLTVKDNGQGQYLRRNPLTVEQAKQFMVQKLKLKTEANIKAQEAKDVDTKQSDIS